MRAATTVEFGVVHFCGHRATQRITVGPGMARVIERERLVAKAQMCPRCLRISREATGREHWTERY